MGNCTNKPGVKEEEDASTGVVAGVVIAGASLPAAEEEPTDMGGAQLAPAGTHATDKLIRPAHIDEAALLGPFMRWGGRPRWR